MTGSSASVRETGCGVAVAVPAAEAKQREGAMQSWQHVARDTELRGSLRASVDREKFF